MKNKVVRLRDDQDRIGRIIQEMGDVWEVRLLSGAEIIAHKSFFVLL